ATMFRKPAFRHMLAGGALTGFGMQGYSAFMPLYFARVHDIAPGIAGLTSGIASFCTVAGGLMIGGSLASWGAKRDMRWFAWIPALGCLLSTGIYIAGFSVTQTAPSIVLIVLGGVSLMTYYGPSLAVVQNLSLARSRASTIAIYQLIVNLVGLGFGPMVIGYASDRIAAMSYGGPLPAKCMAVAADVACRTALADGLRYSFILTSALFVWASLHYFLAGRAQPRGVA
ncbi:MAG: hypothetical protein ABIO39_05325, partial [Caulobacteraceae bacterium]